MFSGAITIVVALAYVFLWTEYVLPEEKMLYPAPDDVDKENAVQTVDLSEKSASY